MREAAAPALPAVRSIAQISWREDMVMDPLGSSLVSTVNLTDSGKARVNRRPLVAESGRANQARQVGIGDRSEVLTGSFTAADSLLASRRAPGISPSPGGNSSSFSATSFLNHGVIARCIPEDNRKSGRFIGRHFVIRDAPLT